MSAWLYKLICRSLASMHVLNLRIAQGCLCWILELLGWCCVRTQNVARAHWEAIATCYVSIACSCPSWLRSCRVGSHTDLIIVFDQIVVGNYSIAALLLQKEDLVT